MEEPAQINIGLGATACPWKRKRKRSKDAWRCSKGKTADCRKMQKCAKTQMCPRWNMGPTCGPCNQPWHDNGRGWSPGAAKCPECHRSSKHFTGKYVIIQFFMLFQLQWCYSTVQYSTTDVKCSICEFQCTGLHNNFMVVAEEDSLCLSRNCRSATWSMP